MLGQQSPCRGSGLLVALLLQSDVGLKLEQQLMIAVADCMQCEQRGRVRPLGVSCTNIVAALLPLCRVDCFATSKFGGSLQ